MTEINVRWIGSSDVDATGYGTTFIDIDGHTVEVDLELEAESEIALKLPLDWSRVTPQILWRTVAAHMSMDAQHATSEVSQYILHHARALGSSVEVGDIIPISLSITLDGAATARVVDCGLGFDVSQYVLAFSLSYNGDILGVSFES
jgi:hypothetical protein